ncbi:DNA polymerase III subunit delta [Acidipila rosea]|uniref:DNA polymerase III subunit delta n=1 Tax=Acidipila rosea TaxID=768535 RepID=A0A4R1L3U4_9BACT|nr:DNA polymerase III subunit delta [Acidipila rosea]MBW4027435.1 DNA polymerase III subunit delta [Acidobacteriota bacterium]MBW4045614.1 DNA polymerase III subunit delta [Acidobacteriota bacterium]TCK71700.1 DNA polymerase III delta subunit [Acidipila rosea]
MGAGFQSAQRFIAEVESGRLRPGYVFAGNEIFLYERCRKAVLRQFVPPDLRDFCLSEFDLAETSIFEILDLARTPSLMAPFQVLFVRNLKQLYTRGAKKDEFAAIDAYFRSPNPQALVIFVADHIRIPSDVRRMDMDDKNRYERIRETLAEWCGIVELAQADEADAVRWIAAESERQQLRFDPDAARELADALGADMMLIANEFEKLSLYVGIKKHVTLGDVETMVLAAKQRSLYELTDAISSRDRKRALELLEGLLNSSDGGEDSAIGHLYMLARTFRQMLVILEKNVRDSRAIWQALWQGFRMPPFAADDLIRQARRYKSRRDLMRALRLIARADLELRSQPPDKRLVLERLVIDLASEPKIAPPFESQQYAMDL